MALPLFVVAVPVLHSSGAWIASTAATGYLAGTLSSTWIGSFVLGNSSLLSSLGLVSGAGIFGASGGLAALTSGASLGIGSALSAVGLGGVASALGIAPVATFLGLTPVGWAVTGTAGTVISVLGYYFVRKIMRQLNREREKGGLEALTLIEIVEEVERFEIQALETILNRLNEEMENLTLSIDQKNVIIDDKIYPIKKLKYMVKENGSEEIVYVKKIGRSRSILLIKGPNESDEQQ